MIKLPTINPNNFLLEEIPQISPFSPKRVLFWREQIKKCIVGTWHSGRWMPGKLYFYSNFATIKLNKNNSKIKTLDRPTLRDLEWVVFYTWEEARGFSGFEDDPYYSCDHRLVEGISLSEAPDYLKTPNGTLKTYERPRDYLYKTHKANYGRPLYNNQAKNFMMMGPRTYGKALHPDTLVIKYPYKTVPLREISVGDIIMSGDGTPTTVRKVTPTFQNLKMYDLVINRHKITACEDHLWNVWDRRENKEKVVATKDLKIGRHFVKLLTNVKSAKWPFDIRAYDFFVFASIFPKLPRFDNEWHQEIIRKRAGKKISRFSYATKKYQLFKGTYRKYSHIFKNFNPEIILTAPREDLIKIEKYIHSRPKYYLLYRKLARQIRQFLKKENEYRLIYSITPSKETRGKCIYVSHPSGTFAIGNGIVTHNSYMMGGGVIAHEYLFDGRQEYDPEKFAKAPTSVNIYVGAGDAKYSNDLLSKTKLTFDNLPGAIEVNGVYYPPPFYKKSIGSLRAGGSYIAKYKVKLGNNWVEKGTRTGIFNRTAKDNPYVFQGGRGTIALMEEIGMFSNARAVFEHTEDVLQDGPANKFGVFGAIGTGGDMGKGTLDAYYMFYHPEEFNFVEFPDIFEHKGNIGLFIPAEYGNNIFKNKFGFTDFNKAREFEKLQRAKRRSNPDLLNTYIVYHPQVPSEIFLVSGGSILPAVELKNRRSELQRDEKLYRLNEKICELHFNQDRPSGVHYSIVTDNSKYPIREFPYKGKNKEGALVIYEFPILGNDGKAPEDLYIIGHDPVGTDTPDGPSMASIYVMKTRLDPLKYGHNEIVAQYIGRPYEGRRVTNELLLKLAMFYNAKIYFENNRGNVKEYFEKHKALKFLAKHPVYALSNKAAYEQLGGKRAIYGFSIQSKKDKLDAIHYIREWLLEERGKDEKGNPVRNLDIIPDPALIDELTYYNFEGNFDRVSAFAGCIIGMEEMFNKYMEDIKKLGRKNALESAEDFFSKQLFKNEHIDIPTTEIILQ